MSPRGPPSEQADLSAIDLDDHARNLVESGDPLPVSFIVTAPKSWWENPK
jgi:hypothetical protein